MLPDQKSPEQPRIGYVLKMFPRFSETFVLHEILALEEQGVEVEIFSLRMPNDGRFHADLARLRATVHHLQPGTLKAEQLWCALGSYVDACGATDADQLTRLLEAPPREAAQALDLARVVRERRITHLHAHFGSVATTVARLAGGLAQVPYSFTAHAKDIFHEEVEPGDLRCKLNDASAVITVSDYNLDHLRATFGPAAASVRRVYNGIDLERFTFGAGRAGEQSVPLRVVGVGRLVEKKGFEHLVDAAALLRDRGVEIEVDIAGTGPLAESLERQIAILGLSDRVRLLGALPQDRVRDLVRSATVFAAPCLVGADGNRDGLPTVLLEAMALGTPCVSTPVTGIPEAIEHDRTGLLVPEDDSPALADALHRLLSLPPLRERLARAARARIESDFDVRRQAARVATVFGAASRRPEAVR